MASSGGQDGTGRLSGWLLGVGVGFAVVVTTFVFWQRPEPAPVATETVASAPHDAATEARAVVPTSEESTETAPDDEVTASEDAAPVSAAPPDMVPSFDVVRVDPDGSAVIAGKAAPGSRVTILLDESEQTDVQADAAGDFVGLLTLPPADIPQVLSLRTDRDGTQARSTDQVIIAPLPAPTAPAPTSQPSGPDTSSGTTATGDDPPEEPSDIAADSSTDAPAPSQPDPAAPAGAADAETAQDPALEDDTADTLASTEPPAAEEVTPADRSAGTGTATSIADPAPAADTPANVAVLRSGADGVDVLQPAEPALPDQVELESISYSDEGAVKLRGRSGAQSVVRVYIDNVAVADIGADGAGEWTGELADIAPGLYTLRLDELAASGSVLSRLETPFKREAPEDLAVPEPEGEQLEDTPLIRAITVQTGDTLWAISRERYGDGVLYVRLFDANRDSITNPDLIYPGQVFTIPE